MVRFTHHAYMNATNHIDFQSHQIATPFSTHESAQRIDMQASALAQAPRPPMRTNAAAHDGLDQPACVRAFFEGEVPPLWNELELCQTWCLENDEPDALLWLFQKTGRKEVSVESLSETEAEVLFAALAKATTVERLSILNTIFTPAIAKLLKSALAENKALSDLTVVRPTFQSDSMVHFAEGLQSSSSLKELALVGCNAIDDEPASKECNNNWNTLVASLEKHASLEIIRIAECTLPYDAYSILFESLQKNVVVREVDISDSALAQGAAAVIGDYLANNESLTKITLSDVQLASADGLAIAEALKINATVKELDLTGNRLDGDFGVACGELLETNKTLEKIDLTSNELGDRGVQAIARALKQNQKLSCLRLGQNAIGNAGGHAVADMLAVNTGLATLDISVNSYNRGVGQALVNNLQGNTTLENMEVCQSRLMMEHSRTINQITTRNRQTRQIRERDALLLSRHGAAMPSWLPPDLGKLLMENVLMQCLTTAEYSSVATSMELALNALYADQQEEKKAS